MIQIKKEKLYLVTGGSGFLGVPLCERILKQGGNVRVLSRDEGKLVELKQKHPNIEILTGDISDKFEVKQAMYGVDGVFHLAASKHVGIAEIQVRECIKTNTLGSMNILEESLETKPDFVLSTGSVLCKWKDLITKGKEVIITEGNATRFFWTVEQALDLIEDCMKNSITTKPYCPEMKSMMVGNLLQAMIEKYSKGQNILIKTIGLQPGENLHEKVMEDGLYSNECEQYTVEDIKELI
mgnify:CR=1 FL=1